MAVAGARRARPRGRMRQVRLPPHPNASHRPAPTRNESEARLRRQLQHNTEKLERSERARTELENRLSLYQDVLAHRDQMINNMEIYSHQHHEEYQEHVNSEMEFMRVSLIDAHNVLEEQTIALAEAHLLDEGSAMRIIELEKRGQLAEAGAAHIVRESMEMRGKSLTEHRERITTHSSTT